MKIYLSLPQSLKPFYQLELTKFQEEYDGGNLTEAWRHLERAHIIGQRYPWAHTSVHWKMLLFGFRIKSKQEIFGQIPRLLFGGVKSFVGKVPLGNPGGADVPPLRAFPIEPELQAIFNKAGLS